MTKSISLLELNGQIKHKLKQLFGDSLWIHAEINELHENANGICYLELIEKGENQYIAARQKAIIWASTYRLLKPYFESTTGIALQSGIHIAVLCSVEFHELYGINLIISDIDPVYTLGDMAQKRIKIIKQLIDDGVLDMNKQLPMPELPQRIAVVSSETAAGYGDFLNQLQCNKYGYVFKTQLFHAVMQGQQAEESIIDAFDKIYENVENFDVVVVIRGGGATSDLSCFDTYLIASHAAQFPLPVICGIGHQRDESILDIVAHKSVKTPTAVADFLIECIHALDLETENMMQQIIQKAINLFAKEQQNLAMQTHRFANNIRWQQSVAEQTLLQYEKQIASLPKINLEKESESLRIFNIKIELNDPQIILKKGYSIIRKNNKNITSIKDLNSNDKINIRLYDGEKTGKIL